MEEEIAPELFVRLVELAALELTPDEGEYLRRELNSQLRAIHELERIPVPDDLPAAAHGVAYSHETRPPLREDHPRPSADADKILAQAPEVDERYFVVPDIPHEQL